MMEGEEDLTTAYKCAHCDWTGKNILQHIRYSQICLNKTDVEDLREKVKTRNRLAKKRKNDEYYKQNKERKQENYKQNKEIIQQNYKQNKEIIQENYKQNRERKIEYQAMYDQNNKETKQNYYKQNREKKIEYQKKYDREHRKERKQRDKFYKRYVKYGGDGSYDDPCASGFNEFMTIAAKHIFGHSLGTCDRTGQFKTSWNGKPMSIQSYSDGYIHSFYEIELEQLSELEKLSQRTLTAHQIDRSIQNEVCCSCSNKLIKLYNINRMQCNECYAAKCFLCKSSVNPNLYEAYQHFWVPRFNSFVPGLCSYFENSIKSDISYKDTCDSCERSDQGSHPTIKDHFSENERRYICNEKCPGEFSTICKALAHCLKAHPPMNSDHDYMLSPYELNEDGHQIYKNGKCYCFITEDDSVIDLSKYPWMEGHIGGFKRIKHYLDNKLILDSGVYKCKFVCKKGFNYPCELWCHLGEGSDHWDNLDKDRSFCGLEKSNKKKVDFIDPDSNLRARMLAATNATNWVVDKVQNIITKICCCHEEKGLFCHFSETEFGNRGPLTSTIFQGIRFLGHPNTSEDPMGGCCKKCKDTDFKLPVYIRSSGIYVILPENVFRFSKVFKSFIKISDCTKPNTVKNVEKGDPSHCNAQEMKEKSVSDVDDESEEESEDESDFSSSYNSSGDDSTNCGGFSGDEY